MRNGKFNIIFAEVQNKAEIEITNILGQSISKKKFENTGTMNMNIEGPAGLYFVVVKNNLEQRAVVKVLKE